MIKTKTVLFTRKAILTIALLCIGVLGAAAQPNPVSWSTSTEKISVDKFRITFKARIDGLWHMYDLGPYEGGPNATSITFEMPKGVRAEGPVKQKSEPISKFDKLFDMDIRYFEHEAVFEQNIKLDPGVSEATLKALIEWMVCDEQNCLPPSDIELQIKISSPENIAVAGTQPSVVPVAESDTAGNTGQAGDTVTLKADSTATAASIGPAEDNSSGSGSLWSTIIEAILWGFAALLTPCVFPMVPMTVSFFMKSNENHPARGRFMAALYGISIVALYTLPIAVIILITKLVGGDSVTADIFNWLATHWIPNIIFFLVFMIFAASFFGAFEITMPSKLVNKSDKGADKGGIIGVFFMAVTLVLVSFSCTGPIVGSVLIKSTSGEVWAPVITMFAFSVAFALPFTLFAFFPSWLKNLPKSGGWLNSVKVTLGFLELALGLKFLSVADQTYHWGILDREIYLALWIAIFALLGLYLLGKLHFKHDDEVKSLSVTRLALSIVTFSFVVYLIPGMWGAPLKGLSGYLPPLQSQDFVMSRSDNAATTAASDINAPKYGDFLHLPHDLKGFFEYNQALAYAAKVGKPLFVDYTGHGCVNCREMEQRVWGDPQVLQILRNDYVIVALYSDDKKTLPESDWVTTDNGRVLKGLGKINANFMHKTFGVNSQPYYLILDGNGRQLVPGRGYNLNIESFVDFLKAGLAEYNAMK